MSDALTDLARDRARAENTLRYYNALAAYLDDPSMEHHEALTAAAEAADNVRGGYWSRSRMTFLDGLGKRVAKLRQHDRKEWAQVLAAVIGCTSHAHRNDELILRRDVLVKLKKLSPFAGKINLLLVERQGMRVDIEHGLSSYLGAVLPDRDDNRSSGHSDLLPKPEIYLLTLPDIDPDDVDIEQIR